MERKLMVKTSAKEKIADYFIYEFSMKKTLRKLILISIFSLSVITFYNAIKLFTKDNSLNENLYNLFLSYTILSNLLLVAINTEGRIRDGYKSSLRWFFKIHFPVGAIYFISMTVYFAYMAIEGGADIKLTVLFLVLSEFFVFVNLVYSHHLNKQQ